MEIHDIIQSDSDRLFMVDPECLILFTGTSKDDIKPFIRIGNWINMPAELIPLIENIIITDSILGNPSFEQFNIDVSQLSENRYIGSRGIVKKFLEYQRIFGLDLNNASIVDIEKDIPLISNKKLKTEKNHFIGVFYRDGNFKILFNGRTIIDLHDIDRKTFSISKMHQRISERSAQNGQYDGGGVIVLNQSLFFYSSGYFVPYHLPADHLTALSRNRIDPAGIKSIIHPSTNFMNLAGLLKWKNAVHGNLKIYSDGSETVDLIKNLFQNANIIKEKFNDLAINTGTGLTVKNYKNTYNIEARFRTLEPARGPLAVAFIAGRKGIDKIINEPVDAILINYSIYEDTNLIFKSAKVPVIIIDDGNPNVSRLRGGDKIVLQQGFRYEFKKYGSPEEIIKNADMGPVIEGLLTGADAETIKSFTETIPEDELRRNAVKLFNLASLLRLKIRTTNDRKTAGLLNGLTAALRDDTREQSLSGDDWYIDLCFCGGLVCEIARKRQEGAGAFIIPDEIYLDEDYGASFYDRDHGEFIQKILSDRVRLYRLLTLFTESEPYMERNSARSGEIKDILTKRKEIYSRSFMNDDAPGESGIASLKENLLKLQSIIAPAKGEKKASSEYESFSRKIKDGPRVGTAENRSSLKAPRDIKDKTDGPPGAKKTALRAAMVLVPALLLAVIIALTFRSDIDTSDMESARAGADAHISAGTDDRAPVDAAAVSDNAIYRYANDVAIKNGYSKLSIRAIKRNNPHWIYPGSTFTMLDGEIITVRDGDNLWNICRDKILRMRKRNGR